MKLIQENKITSLSENGFTIIGGTNLQLLAHHLTGLKIDLINEKLTLKVACMKAY